jgi:hypothetical protein
MLDCFSCAIGPDCPEEISPLAIFTLPIFAVETFIFKGRLFTTFRVPSGESESPWGL